MNNQETDHPQVAADESRTAPRAFWTLPGDLAGLGVERLKIMANRGWFPKVSATVGDLGMKCLPIAGMVTIVFMLDIGLRIDWTIEILLGIIVVLAGVAILQLIASRFLDLCEKVVANSPTQASGLAPYELFGVLLVALGLGLCVFGLIEAYNVEDPMFGVIGILLFLVFATSGFLFLSPSTLNLSIRPANSAGEDGICLLGTLLKAYLAAARFIFGCCVMLGTVAILYGLAGSFFSEGYDRMNYSAYVVAGVGGVVYGALLPVAIYLVTVIYFIVIDALMAIMRIGPKHVGCGQV